MKSIKTKISSSNIIVIVITVLIVQIMIYIAVKGYYYSNLKDTIYGQIKISSDFYNTYLSSNTVKENIFNDNDTFWSNTDCRVQIIDLEGNVIMDSLGYISKEKILTKEVKSAFGGNTQGEATTYQNENNNEKIISVAYPLFYDTDVDGVLRFSASTEGIDKSIREILFIIILLGLLVILISSTISLFISNSVMKPLKLVCVGAEKMAKGNFNESIPKYSKDEIGNLADTLNYMCEEILKNERLKNEFISSVSHELRTPLTSIKGWAIVLESSDLEDKGEVREGLKIIESEVERLTYLVEELLDFSKLISGKITLRKEMVNVDEFTQYILRQLEPKLLSRGIDVEFKSEEVKPIEVDKNRMKQVLINILDNAIKFSPNDSKIVISIMEDNKYLTISIKDHGYGISKEDLPHVKEKFYKGRNINASNGIGLSICDEIITQHEGILEIKSGLQKGTEVIIMLPKGEME
ncbi:HAMP domain-containing sensor histidine kinase [uncultured Clostridium sp.]|uniref:HAMP domain-containing sensor histidine kinase n=1 Tax=uncultured Clostridium sp. TaxID=59620 RepID=UPI0032180AB2